MTAETLIIVPSGGQAHVLDVHVASIRKVLAMSNLLTYQYQEGIASIVLDDGKVNAMSLAMITELNGALDRAAADEAVVVLSGRSGVFSAGFDLKVLRADGDAARTMIHAGFKLSERLLSYPNPVVIACNGHAIAMGIFLVLAADYRFGAQGEYKFGANEVAIGLTMPHFAIEICRQRLAPAHFNRALITSEIYAPEQAVTAGFLDEVVPASALLASAHSKASQFRDLNRAAFIATKARVRAVASNAVRQAIEQDANGAAVRN
jgi:enoyl-CoA hydratase